MKTVISAAISAVLITGCMGNLDPHVQKAEKTEEDYALRSANFGQPFPENPHYIEVSRNLQAEIRTVSDKLGYMTEVQPKSIFGRFDNKSKEVSYSVVLNVKSDERIQFQSANLNTFVGTYSTVPITRPLPKSCTQEKDGKSKCTYESVVQIQTSVFPFTPTIFKSIIKQTMNVDLIAVGHPTVTVGLPIEEFKMLSLANKVYYEKFVNTLPDTEVTLDAPRSASF